MKRRMLFLGGGLALALVLAVGLRQLVRHLAFFSVRRIELVGAQYLRAPEIARVLALPAGRNLFDDLGPLEQRVRTVPGVLEARIARRVPGTLRVIVREAEPVALGEQRGQLVLLDAAGRALPFDPAKVATDLPLADPDSSVTGLLARIRESDPDLFERVQRGSKLRRDVVLELEEGRVLLRADAGDEAIRDLLLVAGVLAQQGRGWRELDARYPPRVVLRQLGRTGS